MNAALDGLRTGLAPFASGLRSPGSMFDSTGMEKARQQVEDEHGGAGIFVDPGTIMAAIERFHRTGEVGSFRDLKYVCLGVSAMDPQGWCILADAGLRRRVVELVKGEVGEMRRIRCFQALLSSYWAFPLNGTQTSEESRAGWQKLRSWLRAGHERIVQYRAHKPPWFVALSRHAVLLSEQPCEQFGADLLRGDSAQLQDAIESLAIPRDSWLPEETVVAHLRAGCGLDDAAFKQQLPSLLDMASGRGEIALGETLRLRCVALLVSRYARCGERPEHTALRDDAVAIIGNPWLRRVNWETWVVDAQDRPDEPSREMVNGWLKRRLIIHFFALLSDDGMGDRRRLDYWLRFEPVIEDMWFALGRKARDRRDKPFKEFKEQAKGRLLDLEDTTVDNNAFVMQIGRHLLVEFGAKGNAMFVFERGRIGQALHNTLSAGRESASVSIHHLKDTSYRIERLLHMDSSAQTWEQKFDDYLVPRIAPRPGTAPRGIDGVHPPPAPGNSFSENEWDIFARSHGLHVEDNRSKQGALWVLDAKQPRHVIAQLEAWGFRCRPTRGWYKFKE